MSLEKERREYLYAGLDVDSLAKDPLIQFQRWLADMIEQQLSAGAVCLSLLNAAHAEGWGANWLTGWISYDRDFLTTVLDLTEIETVAGFIHMGTKTSKPNERERPDLAKITSWLKI